MSVVGPDGTRHAPGSLRGIEHQSIRDFIQRAADAGYLSGRVLDYGCGKQPYRDIVEAAGGEYLPFDRAEFPANVSGEDVGDWTSSEPEWWDLDAVLMTQVVQYLPLRQHSGDDSLQDALSLLEFCLIEHHGYLVLTYPTNWPEVEPEDLHRFTKAGMERLLTEAGFKILEHERRGIGAVSLSGDEFAVGYGVIARA